jgi:hypothetical protein
MKALLSVLAIWVLLATASCVVVPYNYYDDYPYYRYYYPYDYYNYPPYQYYYRDRR